MDYKKKYLKYKQKYLKFKENLNGGTIISKDNIVKKCLDSAKDSIYLPEKCGENFPCLSQDGLCYAKKPSSYKPDPNISSELIKQIYDSNFDKKPYFLKLDSKNDNLTEDNPFYAQNYILESKIDLGTFGKIFSISDINLSKTNMVLKLFIKKINSNILDNYKVQSEICKTSDFINKIYDYGIFNLVYEDNMILNKTIFQQIDNRVNQNYYSVLERYDGGDLITRLLFFRDKINMMKFYFNNMLIFKKLIKNILLGLKAIHDFGYVHADIKPDNIMMVYKVNNENIYSDESEKERVNSDIKIIDFDFMVKNNLNIQKKKFGSVQYMSPKIFNFNKNSTEILNINFKDDMYSLGILMYSCLFVTFPFKFTPERVESEDYLDNLELLKDKDDEIYKLFLKLVSDNESERPTVEDILKSKIFN